MNIFGIGIDIVEVARISNSIDKHGDKFIERIFTQEEIELFADNKKSVLNYCGRFAAKEAISKALGVGIGVDLEWQNMSITKNPSGAPILKMKGKGLKFMEKNSITEIKISISHTDFYACANAIAISI